MDISPQNLKTWLRVCPSLGGHGLDYISGVKGQLVSAGTMLMLSLCQRKVAEICAVHIKKKKIIYLKKLSHA